MNQAREAAKNSPFKCPVCGENLANALTTLRGWKKHMTRQHGGYTDEQLLAAQGSGNEGVAAAGGETFEEAAAAAPESASEYRVAELVDDDSPRISAQAKKVGKKLNADMDGVRKMIAEKFPLLVGAFIYTKMGKTPDEISSLLTPAKVKPMTEAIETVMQAMGVDFQIQPMNTVIKSRFWLLLYPVGAFAMCFFGELIQLAEMMKKESEDDPDEAETPETPVVEGEKLAE